MDKSWQTQKYNETTILAMWFIKEFWDFLKVRKKYWLIPIFVVLLAFGSLIMISQGTPVVAPFIYTVF